MSSHTARPSTHPAWLIALVTGLVFAAILSALPAQSVAATAAIPGGCSKSMAVPELGVRLRSCLGENAQHQGVPSGRLALGANSAQVFAASLRVQAWKYVNGVRVEKRSDTSEDITWLINRRPRSSILKEGDWFSAAAGDMVRARARVCWKATATSARKCTNWKLSPFLQIA